MMTKEWYADIEVTQELVESCLQEQFSELTPVKEIKYLSEGWDNKVFLVNGTIVFRFPRRKIAVELIERENAVLTKLPRFSDVTVPTPLYLGRPTKHYPYPFQGYAMIEGVPAYEAELNDSALLRSVVTLAGFLKQLHGIDEKQAIAMGAETQVFNRMMVQQICERLQERVIKINTLEIGNVNLDHFQREITAVQKLAFADTDRCLIHGDLDCRHLLFNQQRLAGVIDWGDTGINHRAVDLAIIWNFYPKHCHQPFFEVYGTVDTSTWQYARFLGLYSAFTHMLYAHDIDDRLLLKAAKDAVTRINADLLIE